MTLIQMPTTGSIYRHAIAGLVRRRDTSALPGESFQVADVVVDPASLAAYERVCEFRRSDSVPATYLHVLAFPIAMHLMNSPAFPFGVIGLVHIANTITQIRPVDAGRAPDVHGVRRESATARSRPAVRRRRGGNRRGQHRLARCLDLSAAGHVTVGHAAYGRASPARAEPRRT